MNYEMNCIHFYIKRISMENNITIYVFITHLNHLFLNWRENSLLKGLWRPFPVIVCIHTEQDFRN